MSGIDRATAKQITDEIESVVEEVLTRHGLQKQKTDTTYGDGYAVRITASQVELDASGVNLASPEARAWARYARSYQLPVDGLGRQFVYRNDTYLVAGLNVNSRKFPVLARRLGDGKTYTFAVEAVRTALGGPTT